MEILNILASLRQSKVGAVLIGLQIAVTLAIVANALFIALQQIEHSQRPSGIDEQGVVSFANVWTGSPSDIKARLQTDLAALRALPGVIDVFATETIPLKGGGYSASIARVPDSHSGGVTTSLYPADEHALSALGLKLVAGRWFNADEVLSWNPGQSSPDQAAVIIVTQALARRLFSGGQALGKTVYIGQTLMSIIGVIERMQAPGALSRDESIDDSALVPYLWADPVALYVLRARPGQTDAVLQAAQRKLYEINRARVIARPQTFLETRTEAYRPFHATALILGWVCAVLLLITGLGVVGLTSFWVAQRRRQIGIRRALGARRIDILRYFHLENLLLVGTGAVLGVGLTVAVNLYIVGQFEMARLPGMFVLFAVALVVCLGQLSVLWPALRAAAVPPALAARGL